MKPALISFKTSPEVKEALEKLAKEGFRSLSAQCEMIIIKYLENQNIDLKQSKE
jgi:hypothetical protein